ncbi:hypothetical protein [Clostridium sp.]|uniref:hypothetical protein n=1 Tax=Clostridium sp. TaxID=1506 RepID=UPI00257E468D|nr:hypothetical protein [Clostridium sp.]MBS4840165.1 hypothetical protein [Clostridium sp.]MDU1401078.1 hypothetical protein [Clostridium sp.]MDU4924728.1 hypothetical protein [Clostridium sp.]
MLKKDNKTIRRIFLDDLPKIENYGLGKKEKIDWKLAAKRQSTVYFIYDDIHGQIKIIDYIKGRYPKLIVKYGDNDNFEINVDNFCKCKIKVLIGLINHNHKYLVNDIIKNEKVNLQIIKLDKDNRGQKYYKYRCLKCGNIDKIYEGQLKKGGNCNVCGTSPKKVQKETNSIWKTNPELIRYIVNKEDLYKYSKGSRVKVLTKCPNCEQERKIAITKLCTRNFSCTNCNDGISYGEKFMFYLLCELTAVFENRKIFEWSKKVKYNIPKLCGTKIYDFYIPSLKCIIETNGEQHYKKTYRGNRTYEEEVENDKLKEKIAKENGIGYYISINSSEKNMNFIKNNIMESKLNELFDLSNIDWLKCDNFARKSRIKEASEIWNSGNHNCTEIGKIMKLDRHTIYSYLKKSSKLKWCNYEEAKLNKKEINKSKKEWSKSIICLETGRIFNSANECERVSIEVFGVRLIHSMISLVCTGKRKQYKGYHFKFISSLDETQIREIQKNADIKNNY